MEEGSEDPLVIAVRKYNEVLEYAQNVAAAADYLPNVAFDKDANPHIGNKDKNYDDEEEALADLRTNSLLLSDAWEDAQKYFEGGAFRDEFLGYHGGDSIGREEDEAYRKLTEKAKLTEMELWELDEAVSHVLENPPSEKQCTVKFEAGSDEDKDIPDRGDFY